MSLAPRDRNVIIGGALAVLAAALVGYCIGLTAGESSEVAATGTRAAISQAAGQAKTPDSSTSPGNETASQAAGAGVDIEVRQAAAPAGEPPLEVVSTGVTPQPVAPLAPAAFTVKVRGDPEQVICCSVGAGGGSCFPLLKKEAAGDLSTWSETKAAPAGSGTYPMSFRVVDLGIVIPVDFTLYVTPPS